MEVDEEGWPGGAAVMTDGWTPRRGLRSSRIYENIHKLADVWWIVCGLALARSLWMLLYFYFSRHSCRYSLSVTCIQILRLQNVTCGSIRGKKMRLRD